MSRFVIEAPAALARFIAEKGSVALDGTSLTVNSVAGNEFSVLLIPHTLAVTTWGERQGAATNSISKSISWRAMPRVSPRRNKDCRMLAHWRMFAGYNTWANALVYDQAAKLSDADYRADRGAFFKSVHGTLNHLLVADRIWMHRFIGEGETTQQLDAILHESFDDLRTARGIGRCAHCGFHRWSR